MSYFVYLAKNYNNKLYTGTTKNTESRIKCHNLGQGAIFIKRYRNFRVVFIEEYETLEKARKREIQIKNWRRDKKEMLIEKYSKGLATKIDNH